MIGTQKRRTDYILRIRTNVKLLRVLVEECDDGWARVYFLDQCRVARRVGLPIVLVADVNRLQQFMIRHERCFGYLGHDLFVIGLHRGIKLRESGLRFGKFGQRLAQENFLSVW